MSGPCTLCGAVAMRWVGKRKYCRQHEAEAYADAKRTNNSGPAYAGTGFVEVNLRMSVPLAAGRNAATRSTR